MRIGFTLPQGQDGTLTIAQAALSDSAAFSWGNPSVEPPPGGLATFSAAQWNVVNEPSLTANTIVMDILALPAAVGWVPERFEYEISYGGNTEVLIVPWWINVDFKRRIFGGPNVVNTIRLRIVWRNSSTDELTESDWSTAKTVTPGVGAPSITFTTDFTTGYAGSSFNFEAEGLGFGKLNPYSDIRYKWILPAAAAPMSRVEGLVPWPDGIIYGPFCVVNIDAVGSHVLICEATDGYTTITATVTITTTDWDGITAWISSTGDFTNAAPADALNLRYASIPDARAAHNGRFQKVRFLLNGDETHGEWGDLDGYDDLIVRSYEGALGGQRGTHSVTGGDALLKLVHINRHIIVRDLQLVGPYDPAVPNSVENSPPTGIQHTGGEGLKTFWDLSITGFVMCIDPYEIKADAQPYQVRVGENVMVHNCHLSKWYNMGILASATGKFFLFGNDFRQGAGALNDANNKLWAGVHAPLHGPVRISRPRGPVAVCMNRIGSWNGWGSIYEHQPCLRWNAAGYSGANKLSIFQNVTEGSAFAANPNNQNDPYPSQFLLRQHLHFATTQPTALMSCAYGGAVIENVVVVQDDVPAEQTNNNVKSGINLELDNYVFRKGKRIILGNGYVPSRVNGLTFIDLRSDENTTLKEVDEVLGENSGWEWLNVCRHVPNRTDGQQHTSDGPFDLTSKGTPSYIGRRVSTEAAGALQTQYANSAAAFVIPVPAADAGVVGTLTGPPPIDDFYGKLRPRDGTAARGALEPGSGPIYA